MMIKQNGKWSIYEFLSNLPAMRYEKNVPIEQLNIYVREYLVQNSLDENWMNLKNFTSPLISFSNISTSHCFLQ